jgi:hypothetical protein
MALSFAANEKRETNPVSLTLTLHFSWIKSRKQAFHPFNRFPSTQASLSRNRTLTLAWTNPDSHQSF